MYWFENNSYIINLSLTGQVIHLKENGQPTETNDVMYSKAFCSIKASSSSSRFGRYPPIFSQAMRAVSAVK